MSTTDTLLERLRVLVSTETPSADAHRLGIAYELISRWGSEALGRDPVQVVEDGVPHLLWDTVDDPSVLILCHADTVFPAGTIDQRPFRIEDGCAYGPGVFDMKAGIVVAVESLASIDHPERVALLISGDEEIGSITSRALIESVAQRAGAVLVPEPSLDGALKVGRKGGAFYDLAFDGLAAHAGLEPELGSNALSELARWVIELPELADQERGTSVTPTLAQAGTAMNVVPDRAALTVDVRATTLVELERVDAAIRGLEAAAHGHPDGVRVNVTGGINRPPLEEARSRELVSLCQRAAREIGLEPPATATVGGASDGNFTSALGIPTLDGLGPLGSGAHAAHEWVDLESMSQRVPLMTRILTDLTTAPSD